MARAKQDWDTQAWVLGLVGGVACGGLHFASDSARFAMFVDAHARISFPGLLPSQMLHALSTAIGVILLPALISGLARRRPFLWGLLPIVATLLPSLYSDLSSQTNTADDLWFSLLMMAVLWLLIPGPVSLFRWLRARAGRRHEAAQAMLQAQMEVASLPREGVWPPPPDYRP